jgi:hypothetical protein
MERTHQVYLGIGAGDHGIITPVTRVNYIDDRFLPVMSRQALTRNRCLLVLVFESGLREFFPL